MWGKKLCPEENRQVYYSQMAHLSPLGSQLCRPKLNCTEIFILGFISILKVFLFHSRVNVNYLLITCLDQSQGVGLLRARLKTATTEDLINKTNLIRFFAIKQQWRNSSLYLTQSSADFEKVHDSTLSVLSFWRFFFFFDEFNKILLDINLVFKISISHIHLWITYIWVSNDCNIVSMHSSEHKENAMKS